MPDGWSASRPDPVAVADPRRLLVDGVGAATLMQVATVGDTGFPALCHVWFQAEFEPDRLTFLSREDREHVINLRNDPRVAASIALEVPSGLGSPVRGVTLSGLAQEIPGIALPDAAARFVTRWPRAAAALDRARVRSRLYEITVLRWVLFDEINFPDEPRIEIPGR
jgi:hypothetical protein